MINKSPIARKLMFMIVAFSATITVVTTGAQLLFDYKKELSGLKYQIKAIRTTQIDSLSHSIWTFDSKGIQIIIDSALQIQDIEYLSVHINDKHFWSGGELVSRKTIDTKVPIHFKDGQNNLVIGSLRIVGSLDNVYERLLKRVILIFIGNGIKTFFVSFFILFLFQRLVTRHLINLAEYATKVASGVTNSSFRLNRKKRATVHPDELDNAASAINLMRENLHQEIQKIKQAEETLRANEEDLIESQRIARVGSWRLDISSNHVIWSEELYKIYGFDPALPPPPYTEHQKLFTPESWELLSIALTKTVETGIPYELELEMVRDDGSLGWVWVHGETSFDAQGQKVGLKGATQDITERKQAEEDNKKLTAQLLQAQKMEAIGTLAGGIAHDFNNILAAILGYAEMAKEDCQPRSTISNNLNQVLEAGNRAKSLVRQILAFSRQDDTERIILQPGSIVKETITLLRPSLPTTIEITQDIDAVTGFVFVDPSQLNQILMNLCTNAFHAMEDNGGKLDISLKEVTLSNEDLVHEPHVTNGTFIQLSISDSGTGIAPAIKCKIFDPYFTTKEIGKGTGMGLSLVHGIVKNYGGFISLESEPDEGTVFHVFLPTTEKKALTENEINDQIPIGKERILFVDDEEILAQMSKTMLERLGYHVTVKNNGLEALETFQNQPDNFDVVITDQTMPGMTGSDLSRRMLQIRPDVPIILCTGYSTIISEDKAKAMGIKEFAFKPVAKKDIAKLIRKVLDVS